jgi:GT2 family glycosyltransferase
MKILVIIITYNGSKWIDKCFGSVINSSIPSKILAIDNNSIDNTTDLIKKNYPDADLIESGENLGFGKANNIGFKKAIQENFDYIFLLNQDAWIEYDTIEKLINIHQKNNYFGILAPLQLNGSGTYLDSKSLEYSVLTNRNLLVNAMKGLELDTVFEVDFANAACWLMPLSTLKSIGGFDPIYPHYGEDDDYVNRLARHKLKIGLYVKCKVYHDREERNHKKTGKALTNELYIQQLIEIKNPRNIVFSKGFYLKQIVKSIILFVIRPHKSFYKSKVLAYCLLLKNYTKIISHKKQEEIVQTNYL